MHNTHSQRGEWPAILASYIARWHWCYCRLLAGTRKEQPMQRWGCSRGLFTSEWLHQSGQPWSYWMVTTLLLGIRLFLDSLGRITYSPPKGTGLSPWLSYVIVPWNIFVAPQNQERCQVKRFFQWPLTIWILTPFWIWWIHRESLKIVKFQVAGGVFRCDFLSDANKNCQNAIQTLGFVLVGLLPLKDIFHVKKNPPRQYPPRTLFCFGLWIVDLIFIFGKLVKNRTA